MYNLYDNSFLPEDSQNLYIANPLNQIYKYYPTIKINELIKYLITSPELIYKIIKYANEKDLSDSFLFFITNNLFNNIISPEIISEKLLIIYENLLFDEINKISNINEIMEIFTHSKISKLFLGLKYFNEVQNYFNILVGDIIENYENSGMNAIPLIFKVNKLTEYIKTKEEMINKELNSEKEFKREEAKRKRSDEMHTLNNIYKMKFQVDDSKSSSMSGLFSLDEEEDFYNEMNNSSIFMEKYAPDLNKNELTEILRKYSDNEYIQNYLKRQLDLLVEDENLFSNMIFFGHIQVLKDSEKILYYYQRNFNIVKDIISTIYQKLKTTAHLMPYSIKCICKIIYNLLKLKFPDLDDIEIYKYIKIFFFKIILEQFILSSDYSSMMTTTIISQETKHNLKVIFDIWKQFIYGHFYTNNNEEYCDYTPFNWYFIDIIKETIGNAEKLIDVNIPKSLLRNDLNENNNKHFEDHNNNEIFYVYSTCFSLNNLSTLLRIINSELNDFLEEKLRIQFNDCLDKLKEYENLLKSSNNLTNIKFYYIYYDIFFSSEISDIIYEEKKEKYLKLKELEKEKNNEEINQLIKAKNTLIKLIYNTDLTSFINKQDIHNNELKKLLLEIDKYNKKKDFFVKSKEKNNNEYFNLDNINLDLIPSPDNSINSLILLIDNINENYSKENYKLFFQSIYSDISSSTKKYNFEILSPMIESLNNIKQNTSIYLQNQEKYKNIIINSKIRKFIENEQINAEIKFIYNEEEHSFSISEMEKFTKISSKKLNILNTDKDQKIISHSISDFIRKFPNFSKLHQKKEIDLLDLKTELNIKEALMNYFNIVKKHLIKKFSGNEIKNVYSKIKKRILIKLYNKIFPKEPDDDDLTFHFQCLSFSWIQPIHLNINYIDNDIFIKLTTNLFNQMNIEKSYYGKLEIIEKIFTTFSNVLKITKGINYSTDDIAPLCEYALIKAKPDRLSSNLKYIQIMMPEKCSNIYKMHFDYLKNYIDIIKNCNYKHFYGITEKEFNNNCFKAKNEAFTING